MYEVQIAGPDIHFPDVCPMCLAPVEVAVPFMALDFVQRIGLNLPVCHHHLSAFESRNRRNRRLALGTMTLGAIVGAMVGFLFFAVGTSQLGVLGLGAGSGAFAGYYMAARFGVPLALHIFRLRAPRKIVEVEEAISIKFFALKVGKWNSELSRITFAVNSEQYAKRLAEANNLDPSVAVSSQTG